MRSLLLPPTFIGGMSSAPTMPMSQLWGDEEPSLAADLHWGNVVRSNDADVPALDDLADTNDEGEWPTSVVGRVELLPVRELAGVVRFDLHALQGLLAVSDDDVAVLEAGRARLEIHAAFGFRCSGAVQVQSANAEEDCSQPPRDRETCECVRGRAPFQCGSATRSGECRRPLPLARCGAQLCCAQKPRDHVSVSAVLRSCSRHTPAKKSAQRLLLC